MNQTINCRLETAGLDGLGIVFREGTAGGREAAEMTADDMRDVSAITLAVEAGDSEIAARLVYEYYRDRDRADRTPRQILYLHIGMLAGMLTARR